MSEHEVMDRPEAVRKDPTMRYQPQEMFRSAASLAVLGMKLVKLHGVQEDGSCTCSKGHDCPNAGKHPAGGEGWQHLATGDEERLAMWFESDDGPAPNLGVLLGEASGVVDIEADTAEGMAAIQKFGLDRIDTPAFRSGRSPHFLFKWEAGLPGKAVVHVAGIECRLGNDGAAQSVFPPSWHASGVRREWLPGRSPDDVDLKPLPENFRKALIEKANGNAGSGRAREARQATAAGREFKEGEGRHAYLHGEALSLARAAKRLDDEEELRRIENIVLSLNETRCKPPYPSDDVLKKVADAVAWVKRTANEGVPDLRPDDPNAEQILAAQRTPWQRMGLEKLDRGRREHGPGSWKLTVCHSDPTEYIISGIISPSAGSVEVALSAEEFLSASKTAAKILATTGDVDPTNPNSAAWRDLWGGHRYKDDQDRVHDIKGLKAKLMEACEHEHPPAESQRYATLAAWLLDYLRRFKMPTSDDVAEASPSGAPKWVFKGGRIVLTLRYEYAWRKAAEQAGGVVTVAEQRAMGRRIRTITGEKKFTPGSCRGKKGESGFAYMIWTDAHIAALERLSGVEMAQGL